MDSHIVLQIQRFMKRRTGETKKVSWKFSIQPSQQSKTFWTMKEKIFFIHKFLEKKSSNQFTNSKFNCTISSLSCSLPLAVVLGYRLLEIGFISYASRVGTVESSSRGGKKSSNDHHHRTEQIIEWQKMHNSTAGKVKCRDTSSRLTTGDGGEWRKTMEFQVEWMWG